VSLNRIENKHGIQDKNSNNIQRHTIKQNKNVKKVVERWLQPTRKGGNILYFLSVAGGKFVVHFSFP